MPVTLREHALFVQRTLDAYRKEQRRACLAGEQLDYALEDLRVYVFNNIGERHCTYCLGPITTVNFALTPKNPRERGGSCAFHNLSVTCAACAAAKGVLDYMEYKELMALLRTWSPFVRRNFLARLRAAAHVRDGLEYLPNPRLLG